MKRNSRRLSGWIVLAVIALSVAMIGAGGRFPPEGPLALLYAQIHALFVEADQLAAESSSQQDQIDQLTGAVCGLSVLTGNPAPPELCEVVVTATCGCDTGLIGCDCDPGPDFELVSCEYESFPHPDFGEVSPLCEIVDGCRGTFTRTASGDVGSIEVEPTCAPEYVGDDEDRSGGVDCPSECFFGCPAGSSICNPF